MLDRTRKKLREAEFFLWLMTWEELAGELDADEFCLSAFLSAARSVTFAMSKDHEAKAEVWTTDWIGRLPAEDRALMAFFVQQRNKVQKQGTIDLEPTVTIVTLAQFSHEFLHGGRGSFRTIGTPGLQDSMYEKTETRFAGRTGDRVDVVCRRYLDLLKTLVADFEREHRTT
jgi:hypothetical protein